MILINMVINFHVIISQEPVIATELYYSLVYCKDRWATESKYTL